MDSTTLPIQDYPIFEVIYAFASAIFDEIVINFINLLISEYFLHNNLSFEKLRWVY
jgi:hypothetical protein